MLAAQRRELITARLARDGRVVAKDVARDVGVSEDSVRRDLRDMAAAGLCQRVYGGALPAPPAVADHAARGAIAPEAKARVAAAAAALIAPVSTVILDGGTTALAVVAALPPGLRATVVTHAPAVAAALAARPGIETHVIGGRLLAHSVATCGAAAVEAAQGISADLFLMGVTGVHPDAGLTTGDGDEAAMKRALARRAAETYVLASAEKIGAASRFAVLPLEDVTGVITDAPPGDGTVRRLARAGARIVHAGPGGAPLP